MLTFFKYAIVSILGVFTLTIGDDANAALNSIPMGFSPPGKKALIIGNENYESHEELPAATNDSLRVQARLKEIGFKTTRVPNVATVDDLIYDVITPFARTIEHNDIVVVYYSGHGFSLGGFSYMAPIDLKTQYENAAKLAPAGFPVENLFDEFERSEPGYVLVIFDACRTIDSLTLADGESFTRKGGARVGNNAPPTANFSIHFASSLGASAPAEGDAEGLSPFTRHLLDQRPMRGRAYSQIVLDTKDALAVAGWDIGSTWQNSARISLLLGETKASEEYRLEQWRAVFNPGMTALQQWEAVKRFADRHKISPYQRAATQWLEQNPRPQEDLPTFTLETSSLASSNTAFTGYVGWTAFSPHAVQALWDTQETSSTIAFLPYVQSNVALPRASVAETYSAAYQDFSRELIVSEAAPTKALATIQEDYVRSLVESQIVITSQATTLRSGPSFTASTIDSIRRSTPVVAIGSVRDDQGGYWLQLGEPNAHGFRIRGYIDVRPEIRDARSSLGQNIAELTVPESSVLPGVIDSEILTAELERLRKSGISITHVSLATGQTDSDSRDSLLVRERKRDLLLHAGFILRSSGIDGNRQTFVDEASGVEGFTVRMRIFGFF